MTMITVHEENHLHVECKKLSKTALSGCMFDTVEQFINAIETGFFQQHDCDANWACVDQANVKYIGNSVTYEESDTSIEFTNQPTWATHVFWSSK